MCVKKKGGAGRRERESEWRETKMVGISTLCCVHIPYSYSLNFLSMSLFLLSAGPPQVHCC